MSKRGSPMIQSQDRNNRPYSCMEKRENISQLACLAIIAAFQEPYACTLEYSLSVSSR